MTSLLIFDKALAAVPEIDSIRSIRLAFQEKIMSWQAKHATQALLVALQDFAEASSKAKLSELLVQLEARRAAAAISEDHAAILRDTVPASFVLFDAADYFANCGDQSSPMAQLVRLWRLLVDPTVGHTVFSKTPELKSDVATFIEAAGVAFEMQSKLSAVDEAGNVTPPNRAEHIRLLDATFKYSESVKKVRAKTVAHADSIEPWESMTKSLGLMADTALGELRTDLVNLGQTLLDDSTGAVSLLNQVNAGGKDGATWLDDYGGSHTDKSSIEAHFKQTLDIYDTKQLSSFMKSVSLATTLFEGYSRIVEQFQVDVPDVALQSMVSAVNSGKESITKSKILQLQIRVFRTIAKSRKPGERLPCLFTEFSQAEGITGFDYFPIAAQTLLSAQGWKPHHVSASSAAAAAA